MELVKQGLVAPHRAIATACFSIGLPKRLFSRLRPVRPHFWAFKGNEAERRMQWEVAIPLVSSDKRWVAIACRLAADLVIMSCVGIMLWRSWVINTWTMVSWKCETPMMQFAWLVCHSVVSNCEQQQMN